MTALASEDHIEVEWQFSAFDTRPVARWLTSAALPGYRVEAGETRHLADAYFDTPGWRVHHAGFTCRVRHKPAGAELTLKSMAGSVDGVRSRREITDQLAAGAEEPIAAPGPAGELLRLLAGPEPLERLFELRTERRVFILADDSGPLAEIALDVTTIPVGEDLPVRLNRVEIELIGGTEDRAHPFVEALAAATGLVPAITSKFESALVATGHVIPKFPPALGPEHVAASMTAEEAALAILRRQFSVMLANEAGTRVGEDPEALHDMRVATRRMRAAMSAFRAYLPRIDAVRRELGWLARALGDVRDLDVQLERFSEQLQNPASETGSFAAVLAILESRRMRARKRLLRALDSRRYERLVQRLTSLLGRRPSRRIPGTPILAAAPEIVGRSYRRFRRDGEHVTPGSPPADYHALRITAKKLRYAIEFVAPLFGKQAADFAARVTALQDLLGQHQDDEVAAALLEHLAHSARPRLDARSLLAIGALCERYRQDAAQLRAKFPSLYRPVRPSEFRRLGRAMASRVPAESGQVPGARHDARATG